MVFYVCDIQFFRNNDKSIILKSLSCTKLFNDEVIDHFIFKPPFDFNDLNLTRRAEARHVSTFYHHINWNEGFIPYNDMIELVRSYFANATEILVKGDEKGKFLNSILRRNVCYNVEQLNCPNLKELKVAHTLFSKPPVSTLNVIVLKKWMLELYQNCMDKIDTAIETFNKIGFVHMKSYEIYFLPTQFLIDKVDSESLKICLNNLPPHVTQKDSFKKHMYSDEGYDEPDNLWGSL